jgi:hypothetical protein
MQNEDRPAQLPITDAFEALRILDFMCEDNHIDPDLFQIFIDRKLYQEYATNFMDPEQID